MRSRALWPVPSAASSGQSRAPDATRMSYQTRTLSESSTLSGCSPKWRGIASLRYHSAGTRIVTFGAALSKTYVPASSFFATPARRIGASRGDADGDGAVDAGADTDADGALDGLAGAGEHAATAMSRAAQTKVRVMRISFQDADGTGSGVSTGPVSKVKLSMLGLERATSSSKVVPSAELTMNITLPPLGRSRITTLNRSSRSTPQKGPFVISGPGAVVT